MKSAAPCQVVSLQSDSESFERTAESSAEQRAWPGREPIGSVSGGPRTEAAGGSTRLQRDSCLVVPLERQMPLAVTPHAAENHPRRKEAHTTRRGRARLLRPPR